ncbi:MAG: CPBP family intramembrane metalloprotease [Clostridiales bacterium]|nr:CPBP family intramembrane metalloprotease [Clostridiales bacterium]
MSKTCKVLLAMLGLAVLKRPVDVLLAVMLPDVSVNPAVNCLTGALVSILLLGIPAWLLRPWTSLRLPQTKSIWQGMLLGAAMALLTRVALSPVDAAWRGWLRLTPNALPVPENLPVAVAYIMALAVIPAITEEVFFRGAVLTGLLDGSRRETAVLLTTAAFAFMHGSLVNIPSLLAVSLVLTLTMLHSGRISVAIATHFFYNISALAWAGLPGWGSLLCGAGLIGMMAYVVLRQPKMAHPPMKKADGLIAAAALIVLAALYFI